MVCNSIPTGDFNIHNQPHGSGSHLGKTFLSYKCIFDCLMTNEVVAVSTPNPKHYKTEFEKLMKTYISLEKDNRLGKNMYKISLRKRV